MIGSRVWGLRARSLGPGLKTGVENCKPAAKKEI